MNKKNFAAWHVLGECRRHLGDANGALEAFAAACERAETKHVRDAASRGRVEALIFNGRDAEALDALEELEVDAEVLYWRGLAKSRLGQHASAVDDLDAAASKMTTKDVADAVATARCRAGVASLAKVIFYSAAPLLGGGLSETQGPPGALQRAVQRRCV